MNMLQLKIYYVLIRTIEQARFTYSPLGKPLEKQAKTIEGQGKNPGEALNVLKAAEQKLAINDPIPADQLNKEATNEIEKIEKIEKIAKI